MIQETKRKYFWKLISWNVLYWPTIFVKGLSQLFKLLTEIFIFHFKQYIIWKLVLLKLVYFYEILKFIFGKSFSFETFFGDFFKKKLVCINNTCKYIQYNVAFFLFLQGVVDSHPFLPLYSLWTCTKYLSFILKLQGHTISISQGTKTKNRS